MRQLSLLLALSLLLSCTRGAPDDVLLIVGETDPQTQLVLERRLSPICFFELNPDGPPVEPFAELARTTADSSGAYAFELFRAQTNQGGGDRACFRITSAQHPDTELRTQFFDWDVELPRLRGWTEVPALEDGAWTLASVPELPSGSHSTHRALEWHLDSGGEPLWRADAEASLVVSDELLEDFEALALRASARGQSLDYDDTLGPLLATYSEADVRMKTRAVTLPPGGGSVPWSRRAGCSVDGEPVTPCAATDGALARVSLARKVEGGTRFAAQLELHLGEARALRTLVLRGLELGAPALEVEIAHGDDGAWTQVATLQEPEPADQDAWGSLMLRAPGTWARVDLGGIVADRVRLRVGDFGAIMAVREVSVFE